MGPQYDDIDLDDAELKDFLSDYPYHKLFPLSQYKFRKPCKKCIVKAMCSKHCISYFKHLKFVEYKNMKAYKFNYDMKRVRKFLKTLLITLLPVIFMLVAILIGRFYGI